ncbi:hypothetical protein PG999_007823 [Apiospora kogelbergensis]|uniref:UbiA prenyltransferase family protein n=1 Tax=Apiospora kogelbergensis TaxID=1337665 RepID=A0AAW0QPK4_9PEZI
MAESDQHPQKEKAAITQKAERGLLQQIFYHLYTIYLFTASDLCTTCLQIVIFGLFGAASGCFSTNPRPTEPVSATTPSSSPMGAAVLTMIGRFSRTFLFVWLLLLVVQLGNQSVPGAPEEDALNKAWRPIPAGRISQCQVRKVLLPIATVLALLVSFAQGTYVEAAAFVVTSYIYNDLGGADVHWLVRNLLNGVGLSLLNTSALWLAADGYVDARGYVWTTAVGLAIATTIQTADFRDQEGDVARGRRTLPLVVGDGLARWTTAALMSVWAVLGPWLCGAGVAGYFLSIVAAGVAAVSLLVCRTQDADGWSFKLWSVWMTVIYIMPWLSLLP